MTTDLAALSAAAQDPDCWKAWCATRKLEHALLFEWTAGNLVQIDREGMRERVTLNIWHQLGQIEENVRAGQLTMEEVAVLADAAIAAILGGEHDK